MCECHSSTLNIGAVVAWNLQCIFTSHKGFIFSEPALGGMTYFVILCRKLYSEVTQGFETFCVGGTWRLFLWHKFVLKVSY